MKILFLSQRFLLPMDSGGKIRTGNIIKQMAEKHNITLISNVEYTHDDKYLHQIESLCTKFVGVPWKEVKKYSLKFCIRLFFQMFSKYPVVALNDYSRSLRKVVEKTAKAADFDVAICDFVQSALLFKRINSLPTILFQHNVESIIAQRHFKKANNFIGKIFWWLQWIKMVSFEKKACRLFDTVIAVSKEDKETFKKLYGVNNVESIPTGIDVDYFKVKSDIKIEKNKLVFCGSMDWLPNEDAMNYFIKEIMPKINEEVDDVKITIVGRNPSALLKKHAEEHNNVELTGWVADVRSYIACAALVIVPIRIGGGTRMKIYEAMAMGKTVISTNVGAEGLPVTNGENIFLEDDPIKFALKIVELLKDDWQRQKIGIAGSDFVRKHFSWQKVAEKFINVCKIYS